MFTTSRAPKENSNHYKHGPTKRYRPGQVPDWHEEEEEEEEAQIGAKDESTISASRKRRERKAMIIEAPSNIIRKNKDNVSERKKVSASVVVADGIDTMNLKVPEVESPEEKENDEEEDEIAKRRARIRQKMKLREIEEVKKAQEKSIEEEEDDEEEDEESSEYTTDSEEEDYNLGAMKQSIKPLFIPKNKRVTVEEREKIEEEIMQNEDEEKEKEKVQKRKEETKKMVVEILRKDEEMEEKDEDENGLPNDEDKPEDEEKELQLWKVRELTRIKRDAELRAKIDREREETEKRRNMSDAEILAEKEKGQAKERSKMKFMQRYYHKGAFFQHEEKDEYKRDFAVPTEREAEVDVESLPQVLQVKKFGMKGRTKYTHLVDQDTSKLSDNPWIQSQKKYGIKRGALAGSGSISYPTKKKKS